MPGCIKSVRENQVILNLLVSTIVSIQVHLLDFLEERESRVSTGALVIECLLNHSVQSVEEVLLVDAVVLDGLLNTDSVLELVDLLDKTLNLSLIVLAGYRREPCRT